MIMSPVISTPTLLAPDTNIFCGRGKAFDHLPGNCRFRNIIREHVSLYNAPKVSRLEKSRIIQSVLSRIESLSMRFVKHSASGWVEVEEDVIKLKIGHALRDVKRVLRKQSRGKHSEHAHCGRANRTDNKKSSKGAERLIVEHAPRLRIENNKEKPVASTAVFQTVQAALEHRGLNPGLDGAEQFATKPRQPLPQPSPSISTAMQPAFDDDSVKCTSTTHVSPTLSHIFMVNAVPPCDIHVIASDDDPLLSRSINTLVRDDGGEDPYSVDWIASIGIHDLFPSTTSSEAALGGDDCLTFDAMLSALHSNTLLGDCDDGSINIVDELLQNHRVVSL